MSAEEHKAKVIRVYDEVFNGKNPEAFRELVAPDVLLHLPQYPEPIRGVDAVVEWAHTVYHPAWDGHITIEAAIAEGEHVALFWTKRATHTGEYIGLPATGRHVTLQAIHWSRFVDGRAQEVWVMLDAMSMMQQVGLFPRGRPPGRLFRLIIALQRLFGRGPGEPPG